MTITFKYKSIIRPDGREVKTPSIPITLSGQSGLKIEVMALIDSGADLSVIPQDIAELLGLNLDKEKEKSGGIGGEVEVINSNVTINIKKDHEDYTIDLPVQVIFGERKMPMLLGREGFFDKFIIIFDQRNGKISLKKESERVF